MNISEKIRKMSKTKVLEGGIFKERYVFSEAYQAPQVPERGDEENQLIDLGMNFLNPKGKPFNLFIYGKNGVGKTCVNRYVCKALEDYAKEQGIFFKVIEVNCREHRSELQVLCAIQDALTGYGKGRVLSQVNSRITDEIKKGLKAVVILDEVDKLIESRESSLSGLVENIVNMSIKGSPGQVSLIAISNKVNLTDRLSVKASTYLNQNTLLFKPYDAKQLQKILGDRTVLGFNENVLEDGNLQLVSAYAAKTNGDARYGLDLLYYAGDLAEKAGRKKIVKEDVVASQTVAEEAKVNKLIKSLPDHQVAVLYAITGLLTRGSDYSRLRDMPSDVLFSGEAYEEYERVCKGLKWSSRTMRWFGEYLKELEGCGLLSLSISGTGVRGTTTLIRFGSNPKDVKRVCSETLGLS